MLKQCIEVLHFVSCREAVKAMMQQDDILFHWNRLQIKTHLYCVWCREAVKAMMQQNDVPFHESRLQAVGLAEVHTRLCGNLINIYSHSRNTSKQRILLDMLLAISPNNIEYSIRHAQVVTKAASCSVVSTLRCLHPCWASPGHIPSLACCLQSLHNNTVCCFRHTQAVTNIRLLIVHSNVSACSYASLLKGNHTKVCS